MSERVDKPAAPDYRAPDYRSAVRDFDFGLALDFLKEGRRVARAGWNGQTQAGDGMWLILIPGSTITVSDGRPLAKAFPVGTVVNYHAHIDMKTADGTLVPWLCSQTDMLADDWELTT